MTSAALPTRRAVDDSTDGQRGINVTTLLSQAITISGYPDLTDTGEPQASYDALAAVGHRLIRLPIDWNFLQPNLDKGDERFYSAYWRAIKAEIGKIKKAGLKAVLDLHNGCEWTKPGSSEPPLVCGAGLSLDVTTGVWRTISEEFKNEPAVVAYDLFNEPTKFTPPSIPNEAGKQAYSVYQAHVNAIVAALRAQGDRKEIWVESLCCSIGLDINNTDPDGGWVVDPIKRIVYSLHMYPVGFDADAGLGEEFNPAKLDPNYEEPKGKPWSNRGYVRGFLRRLDGFGSWCKRTGEQCSIGEVGWYSRGQAKDSVSRWNELGDEWYNIADYYGLAVTYYGASSASVSPLWVYDAPGPSSWFPARGMTQKQSQASVIEKQSHLSKP
ncbi:glycoside hydrolase family 5 protein [Tsukamurella paurometabola]